METIYTEDFDSELLSLPIYRNYPQMLPLIGKSYASMKKKVIFIGESHYLPDTSNLHLNSVDWYKSNHLALGDTEKEWLNTRRNSGSGIDQKYSSRAFSIYRNIEKGILASGFDPSLKDNMFRYCSFYNYFLRPAQTGISLKRDELDKITSFENLIKLQDILGFNNIIFVSKMAFNDFNWCFKNRDHELHLEYFSLPHPGSIWWNKKSRSYVNSKGESLNGKEKLVDIIIENQLFQND